MVTRETEARLECVNKQLTVMMSRHKRESSLSHFSSSYFLLFWRAVLKNWPSRVLQMSWQGFSIRLFNYLDSLLQLNPLKTDLLTKSALRNVAGISQLAPLSDAIQPSSLMAFLCMAVEGFSQSQWTLGHSARENVHPRLVSCSSRGQHKRPITIHTHMYTYRQF